VRRLGDGEGADEIVAPTRQRSDEIGPLQVDEVFRGLSGVQLGLGRAAPAIGLGAKVRQRIERIGRAKKAGHVGRETRSRKPIDHLVAVIAPSEGWLDSEDWQKNGGDAETKGDGNS
jgi:hypothetical protein